MLIEEFLRSKNMTVEAFCNDVGCCRQVIWKIKQGLPISQRFSKNISEITKGLVQPIYRIRGKDVKKRGSVNDNS